MLFVGSFRHDPNRIAMDWFVRDVMPLMLARRPGGASWWWPVPIRPRLAPTPIFQRIEMLGYVDDVREPLGRNARVHLPDPERLGRPGEAAGSVRGGIPVVSTRVGAEGLARKDGEFCCLPTTPLDSPKVIHLLEIRGQSG